MFAAWKRACRGGRRKSLSAKPRRLTFETVEPRLAMSGLGGVASGSGMLGAAGGSADATPLIAQEASSATDAQADVAEMGQLPPQRIYPNGLPNGETDSSMTDRPGQGSSMDTDLRRWFFSGEAPDFGAPDGDPTGLGFRYGGWGGPEGRSPFDQPFGFDGFSGFEDFGRDYGGDGNPFTGPGGSPLLRPGMNGCLLAGTPADTAEAVNKVLNGAGFWTKTEITQFDAKVEALNPTTGGRFTVYIVGGQIVRINNYSTTPPSSWTVDDEDAETCEATVTDSIPIPKEGKKGDSSPDGDSGPVNPHDVFDSVWYVYANLRIVAPTHDDTRIDILINPRSLSGDAVLLHTATAAYGGGIAAGPGTIDILPFVGNRDPNPSSAGQPDLVFSSVLVNALSVRDPLPLQQTA